MLTLYHSPRSRSSRFIWLLEELGAPYVIKPVSIRRGDGSGAVDPQNPHPHGKVPALMHKGALVFESTAIALYLTDAFPAKKIGPQIGQATRGPYLTWLAYYTGVVEPAFVSKYLKHEVPRGTAGWVSTEETMAYVNKALEAGPYLLGDTFSAADILYASTFALFLGSVGAGLLPKTPALEAYVARCTERPAAKRAQEKDAG
jgi:glutathione S-transferase